MTAALDMFCARARRSPFERDLESVSAIVTSAFGANLEALLLLAEPESRRATELELVAVVRDSVVTATSASAVAASATRVAGIQVRVSVVERAAMRAPKPSLPWLNAALGNVRVLLGDADVLQAVRRMRPRDVPLDEAARLLARRAAGVALTRIDGDVVTDPKRAMRRVFEAVLACGDARLLAASEYGATRTVRALAIERLAERRRVPIELAGAYRAATVFLARPDAVAPPADLQRWFDAHQRRLAIWHMGFESFRLGAPLTALAFAWRSAPLFPKPAAAFHANPSSAVRAFLRGEAALFAYDGGPQERFARAAVALAYLDPKRGHALAARWLGIPGDAPSEAIRSALSELCDR